jgi:hypothetical protein
MKILYQLPYSITVVAIRTFLANTWPSLHPLLYCRIGIHHCRSIWIYEIAIHHCVCFRFLVGEGDGTLPTISCLNSHPPISRFVPCDGE